MAKSMIEIVQQLKARGDKAKLASDLQDLSAWMASSAKRGDRSIVAKAEAAIQRDPKILRFDAEGFGHLESDGRTWKAGRFATPSVDDLRDRAALRRKERGLGKASLWVINGQGPVTDIGGMQATAPEGALFQVASQYNCLEAPNAKITPVTEYFWDPTQGPRASVSAFAGTLLRHYAAPASNGDRFVQRTAGRQVELLEDVCADGRAKVVDGYLLPHNIANAADFAAHLGKSAGKVRVGVHEGVEVALGYNWDGSVDGKRTISQVFTSTVALGGYGSFDDDALEAAVARPLLDAAYRGTLLAAASLGSRSVVLTLIGGGVFRNRRSMIWEAILSAFDEAASLVANDMTVIVNARTDLRDDVGLPSVATGAAKRGGALLCVDDPNVCVRSA